VERAGKADSPTTNRLAATLETTMLRNFFTGCSFAIGFHVSPQEKDEAHPRLVVPRSGPAAPNRISAPATGGRRTSFIPVRGPWRFSAISSACRS
jgi:hypothetical protein